MSKQIQWFPGHMSKTLREFEEISSKVDVYFILVDARAPKSSYIDSFDDIIKNKKVIVILTKADLVKEKELKKWIDHYKEKFGHAYAMSLTNKKQIRKQIINILDQIKFKKLLPKFSIIGAPNVGKSTLLNVMAEGNKAIAEDRAGVTKKNAWFQFNNRYWIMDTPGVLQPKFQDEEQGLKLAIIGSIKIDILPIQEVTIRMFELLKEVDANIPYKGNIEEQLFIEEEESKLQTQEFYKRKIKDFQQNKYGKVILDR